MKNPARINPPAARATSKITTPVAFSPRKGESAAAPVRVAVGEGVCTVVFSAVGDGVNVPVGGGEGVAGGGTGVSLAGGVT